MIDQEKIEKLKILLASEKLSQVKMGLHLADALTVEQPEAMKNIIGKAIIPTLPYTAQNHQPTLWRGWKGWLKHSIQLPLEPHHAYICLWLVGWQKEPVKQIRLAGKLEEFPENINNLIALEEIWITDKSCNPRGNSLARLPNLKKMCLWENTALYRFVKQHMPWVTLVSYKGY